MKKKVLRTLSLILSLVMLASFTGCNAIPDEDSGKKESTKKEDGDGKKKLNIALYLAGFQGDKSFLDIACNGLKLAKEKYPDQIEYKIIDGTFDTTKWEPGLRDLAEADPKYDIIITGAYEMLETAQLVAEEYPDQKFFFYDASFDYSDDGFKNTYSMEFKPNESSFLAGAAGAFAAKAKGQKTIGIVAGQDIPSINDFVVGYIEGAQYVDKDMKVLTSYVGNFEDNAKGKELALAQYNQGAQVIFGAAGQAALGVFDASAEKNLYSIGCDSDQAILFEGGKEQKKADLMVTSALKNIDKALLNAIEMYMEDKVPWGTDAVLGIKEDGVAIAENTYFEKILSQKDRDALKEISEKISSGEIKVDSALNMDVKEVNKIRDGARPN